MPVFSLPHLLDSPRWRGMRVGLLGGTFNPPHEGHVHISLSALKGLELDAVWWLVTPKNPLKTQQPLPVAERVVLAKRLVSHPRILVSDLESDLGTAITYYAIQRLKHRYPATEFVWISGIDNAFNLHNWHHWRDLLKEICMVHLARQPATSLIRGCPLRMLSPHKHVMLTKAGRHNLDSETTYWMLQKKMVNISSSELRNNIEKTIV